MRPTPAQVDILRRLSEGDTLHWMSGPEPYAFWEKAVSDRHPNYRSVFALRDAGLIEETPGSRMNYGWTFRITEAGGLVLKSSRVKCAACLGKGWFEDEGDLNFKPCQDCGGKGWRRDGKV